MKQRIIVAYFNHLTTQLLCESFEHRGYQTINAESYLLDLVNSEKPAYLFIATNPDTDSIDICRQIKSVPHSYTKCIVFFARRFTSVLPSIFADISGYLYEDADIEEIETCLQRLSNGERYITSQMLKQLNNPQIAKYKAFTAPLSVREKEIFRFIAYGYSNTKISDISFICAKTVESHKHSIIKKLNLKDAADLLETAIKVTFDYPAIDLSK